jgi:surface polysaccharide O-acyltransferase-like enzyme
MTRPAPKALPYYPELDWLRGLAIVGVVAIHLSVGRPASAGGGAGFHLVLLLDQAARFSVPVFVLLAGLLVGARLPRSVGRAFLARRLRAVLVPYAAWTAVGLPALLGLGPVDGRRVSDALLLGHGYYYQLYFVPLVCLLYLAAPLVARGVRGRRGRRFALGAVAINLVCLAGYEAAYLSGSALPAERYIQSLPLMWVGYFVAGAWLGARYRLLRPAIARLPWRRLGLISLLALALVVSDLYLARRLGPAGPSPAENFMRPAVLVYSLAVIPALLSVAIAAADGGARSRWFRGGVRLGQLSFGVYLCHLLVQDLVRAGAAWLYASAPGRLAALALVVAGSAVLSLLAGRTAAGRLVMGTDRAGGAGAPILAASSRGGYPPGDPAALSPRRGRCRSARGAARRSAA